MQANRQPKWQLDWAVGQFGERGFGQGFWGRWAGGWWVGQTKRAGVE